MHLFPNLISHLIILIPIYYISRGRLFSSFSYLTSIARHDEEILDKWQRFLPPISPVLSKNTQRKEIALGHTLDHNGSSCSRDGAAPCSVGAHSVLCGGLKHD